MPDANQVFLRILAEHETFIYRRAKKLSRELHKRESEADVDDIAAEVKEEILKLIRRGWMDEGPRVNFTAQARHLIGVAFRHVKSRHLTKKMQEWGGLDELSEKEQEDLDLPAPEHSIEAKEQHRWLLAAIRTLAPSRQLSLLAFDWPEMVSRELVEAAANFKVGGGGLSRSTEETWELFHRAYQDRYPLITEAAWRKIVGEILRGTGPLGSLSTQELKAAVNTIEAQCSQARKQIKKRFPQGVES